MPSISTNKTGGVIRWDGDDWLSGLVPQHTSSAIANITQVKGLAFSRGIDPFRKPGYLFPGPSPNDATNVAAVDALIKNGATNGAKAYLISAGTKLHELDLTNDTVSNAGNWPHTITAHGGHSSVVGEDVIRYQISGTEYLFYSWNDNTDGDVGRYDFSNTFDDDYMSTVPTSGAALDKDFPHPMVVGDDGNLYIGNGKDLTSFDGSTFNSSALDLPPGYIMTSFAKTQNFLVVFAYKSSVSGTTYYKTEAKAFFWDYVSSSFIYAYPLAGNYVDGGFQYKNTIGCHVQGTSSDIYQNKLSKVLLFTGSGFDPVASYLDNAARHGGVEAIDDIIFWNAAGKIYSYGSPYPGFNRVLNKISEAGGTTTGGMLKNFGGNDLYVSAGTNTTGGLEVFNGGYNGSSLFTTPVISPGFGQWDKARVTMVKVFWAETASDANLFTLNLRTGRNGTATTIFSNLSSVTDLVTKYESDSSGNGFPEFESIAINGSYSSSDTSVVPPTIAAIEVYFEYIKL